VRYFLSVERQRLLGYADAWTIPADQKYKRSDNLDSLRYHSARNAVTGPAVKRLVKRFKQHLLTTHHSM
jgi:hypothetical protein